MTTHHLEVLPEMLNRKCDPDSLGFETTEELARLEGLIGQDRAFSALELALGIEEPASISSYPDRPERAGTQP